MRAVVMDEIGPPDVLVSRDLPQPVPGPGELLVKVRAVAVNRFDVDLRVGYRFELAFPHVLGLDVAGDVELVGEGVSESLLGQAVVPYFMQPDYRMLGVQLPGGYAEYIKVAAASAIRKPDALSYEQAAALPLPFGAAWHALSARAGLKAGESILVNAAGGAVGTAAIQLARHIGARVIAGGTDDVKLQQARDLGAEDVVNLHSADLVADIKRVAGDGGLDVVLDPVGGEVLRASLGALAYGGRAVTLGALSEEEVLVNVRDLFLGEQALIASLGATQEEIEHVLGLAAGGVIRPVIDRVLPLAEAAEAHRAIEQREVSGRVLLTP